MNLCLVKQQTITTGFFTKRKKKQQKNKQTNKKQTKKETNSNSIIKSWDSEFYSLFSLGNYDYVGICSERKTAN